VYAPTRCNKDQLYGLPHPANKMETGKVTSAGANGKLDAVIMILITCLVVLVEYSINLNYKAI